MIMFDVFLEASGFDRISSTVHFQLGGNCEEASECFLTSFLIMIVRKP